VATTQDKTGAGEHVVLCGLGELGLRTLEELRRLGEEVVVVARAPAPEEAGHARELGATVVEGSHRHEAVLRAAGIETAAALVATEDDDIENLHAALVAHDLNPGLRIRLRMFNQELGERVMQLFENCAVFDSAALAAPAFVSAALHDDWEQRIDVGGASFVVRQRSVSDPDVVLPLARLLPDGRAEPFPSDGDDVLCLTHSVEGMRSAAARRGVTRLRPRRRGRLATVWALLAGTDRRLRYTLEMVLLLTAVSVVVFLIFADLNLVDAIYFTVTIITTTGFGDIHLRDAAEPLQLYGVLVMLLGAAALAVLFALVADLVVSARLARALGWMPHELENHVIVCGLGNIGYRVVEELARLELPVVAVELDAGNRFVAAVRRLGVPVLIGDVRLRETLESLKLDRARCLVVVTSEDVTNLETALGAHIVNPDLRVVLRLFDADLAARVERAFEIPISRSPAALAAPAFAAAAEDERIVATVAIGLPALIVARATVEPGSELEGKSVASLETSDDVRALLLEVPAGQRWRPPAETVLGAGHELTVVVTRQGLAHVFAASESEAARAVAKPQAGP
jgi:Trk K+ transport system NAD-binding subunit